MRKKNDGTTGRRNDGTGVCAQARTGTAESLEVRTTLPYPDPAVAPTAPLPLTRTLAPTEPPDDEIVTTHQIPVFANAQVAPTRVVQRRSTGWFARIALSIAIVVTLVAIVVVNSG